jgi:phage terminase small subunit
MAGLNDKQERFCQEYVIDLNATQAAIRAGYSKKTAYSLGQRLLKKVEIIARVEELKKEIADKNKLSAEWVIEELKKVHQRCMQAEPVMKWDYEKKQMVETGEYTFDSKGANRALELMGKHISMFTEKLEVKDTTDYASKLKAARERVKNASNDEK